jgi:hypothetical protein
VALGLLGAALLVTLAALLQEAVGLNHDVAWYLYVARSALQGTPYYVDQAGSYLDINPPLVVWILIPPIWLAERLRLPITVAPHILIAVQTGVAIGLTWGIVRRTPATHMLPWAVAVAGLLLVGHDFGQREHQLVLLLAPSLVGLAIGATSRETSRWLRLCAGVSAGIGVAAKPHFVLAWALVEAVVAFVYRQPKQLLRLEVLAACSVLLLYVLAVLTITPGYFSLAREWGPLYLRYLRTPTLLLLAQPECVAILASTLIGTRVRASGQMGRIAFVFGISAASFAGAAILQQKGFSYHWYPAIAFAVISVAATAMALARENWRPLSVAATVVTAAVLAAVLSQRLRAGRVLGADYGRLQAAIGDVASDSESAGRGKVVILSTRLVDAFPMVAELGLEWPLRWPTLWVLEAVAPIDCRAGASGPDRLYEQRVRDGLWEDLARFRPERIIVQPVPRPLHRRPGCATLADHLAREPRFALLFAEFDATGTIRNGSSVPFVIMTRRAAPDSTTRASQASVGDPAP